MTITQTVDIPSDRRVFFEFLAPKEIPEGKAKVTITLQPETTFAQAYEAITNLRGLAKRMGSNLTVEKFLEMRREDLRLEEEKIGRLFPGLSPASENRADR